LANELGNIVSDLQIGALDGCFMHSTGYGSRAKPSIAPKGLAVSVYDSLVAEIASS
jgi:uncharacterized protein (UPF0261 family)